MPYVPGNAAEGFCETCNSDTVQTVLEVQGFQVMLARCEKCGTEAPLKVARNKTKAGLREAMKKKAAKDGVPKRRTRKLKEDPAQIFRKLMEGKELSSAQDYSIKIKVEEGSVIKHKKFGTGVVVTLLSANKAVITFEEGPRTMAFGK